jgi:hypothetical protein
MSADEVRECTIGPDWKRGVLEGYPLLRGAGAELAARGVPFLDASRTFADVRETLYFDACHFGPEGNRILAEAIAEAFLARLPAELAEPSTLDGLFGEEPALARWSSTGPTRRRRVDGVSVYLCLPEGELAFAVPDGAAQASAQFGILPATHAATDGVRFVVELEHEGGSTILFERTLDPRAVEQDRGFQTFQEALPEGSGRTIVLRTQNEPGKHAIGDGAFWSGVVIR